MLKVLYANVEESWNRAFAVDVINRLTDVRVKKYAQVAEIL